MKIVVCLKQVPDTKGGVKFNPDGTLDRAAMLAIMNPDDKAGLEAALRIKEENGAEVTVVTMGLPKAEDIDVTDLDINADTLNALLSVDKQNWIDDIEDAETGIKKYFSQFGDKLPAEIKKQLEILEANLAK